MAEEPRRTSSDTEYCNVCHNFDPTGSVDARDQGLRDQYGAGRLALWREPKEFQDSECNDCALLYQVANEMSNGNWQWLTMWLEKGINPKVTLISPEHSQVSLEKISFEMYCPDKSYWKMPSLKEIPPNPVASESIGFLESRMKECQDHQACQSPEFIPKRLFQISTSRLVEPDHYLPYCALSYCWGKVLALRNTTANHHQFMESIDQTELPVCFKEASTIAQRLGIDYIWIDCLCIIQDDKSDWEVQFPQMANIYEGARLVIAAGSSDNCRDSFLLQDRPKPLVLSHSHDGQRFEVRARRITSNGIHDDYETDYSRRDCLDLRAWPFQERLLATRLLIYSSAELQWQCKTISSMCEGGHQDSPHRFAPSLYSLKPEDAYGYWHLQVMEYSKRLLTYQHDKLPALAGIASKIGALIGSEYIAGLWKKNLFKDMLWERHIFRGAKWEATSVWRAPSFSWASVQGNVFYNRVLTSKEPGEFLAEVVDAHVIPTVAGNFFGSIEHGEVTIRGPLLEARINTPPDWEWDKAPDLFHVERGTWRVRLRSDTHLRQGPIIGDDGKPFQENTAYRTPEDTRTTLKDCKCWILIAARWIEHPSDGRPDRVFFTNIFLGKSERVPGAYERLGHNNQNWPLVECSVEGEQWQEMDDVIHGRGEVQEVRIV